MNLGKLDAEALERFKSKIGIYPDGCWRWMGGRNQAGYGRFTWKRVESVAHRVAWEQWRGAIPDGLKVLHRCDNPPCVNPDHLFLGTNDDNMKDRDSKGRQASGGRNGAYTKPEQRRRGESHGRHKFTEDQVRSIRDRISRGENMAAIAREFAVATTSIHYIKNGKNWAWLQ